MIAHPPARPRSAFGVPDAVAGAVVRSARSEHDRRHAQDRRPRDRGHARGPTPRATPAAARRRSPPDVPSDDQSGALGPSPGVSATIDLAVERLGPPAA